MRSDDELRSLAEQQPADLQKLLTSELPAGSLARVASAAYFVTDRTLVRDLLHSLVRNHASELVREACLQGLEHDEDAATLELFRYLSTDDPSSDIRNIAKEMFLGP